MHQDVFASVADFLCDADLASAMRVCRSWNQMACSDEVWKRRLPKEWVPLTPYKITHRRQYKIQAKFERYFLGLEQEVMSVDALSSVSPYIITLLTLVVTFGIPLVTVVYFAAYLMYLSHARETVNMIVGAASFLRLGRIAVLHAALRSKDHHLSLFAKHTINNHWSGFRQIEPVTWMLLSLASSNGLQQAFPNGCGLFAVVAAIPFFKLGTEYKLVGAVAVMVAVDCLFQPDWFAPCFILVAVASLVYALIKGAKGTKMLVQYILINGRTEPLAKAAAILLNLAVIYSCLWLIVLVNYSRAHGDGLVLVIVPLLTYLALPLVRYASTIYRTPHHTLEAALLECGANLVLGVIMLHAVSASGSSILALFHSGEDAYSDHSAQSLVILIILAMNAKLALGCAEQQIILADWNRQVALKSVSERVRDYYFERNDLYEIFN